MQTYLDVNKLDDYRKFIAIKQLPAYRIKGRSAWYPDEYVEQINGSPCDTQRMTHEWEPPEWMFDYQRDITKLAVKKRKFAVLADCGLGKSQILLEFAYRALQMMKRRGVLIVSPLNVVTQTLSEYNKFFPDRSQHLPIDRIPSSELPSWLQSCGGRIGITNYEAMKQGVDRGQLGGMILDESSMLKSHYGKWSQACIEIGAGLEWKLCCTGTPAPNDRIEYANHAVFLDHYPTVNSFLATFFVNRGQSDNRWELKPHALKPFYKALSHWCIFLTDPSTYGWQDNTENIPPIHVHIHSVPMTNEQKTIVQAKTGELFANRLGGIAHRGSMGQIGKGFYKGKAIATLKPDFIKRLIDSWSDKESTIVWCLYNAEQEHLASVLPDSCSITGSTPYEDRMRLIHSFQAGEIKTLISKPRILGFGLNLQIATRQVFSGLQDSWESYYQAVKRSNRYGSTRPLNVHIPVTDVEEPMVQNVLRKAHRIQQDTEVQEKLFKESSWRGC